MRVLISLIGDQIIPNLLPIKHSKPDLSIAVFSRMTRKGYDRLEKIIQQKPRLIPLEVDAYSIDSMQSALLNSLQNQWDGSGELLFNITGGTKPMSLAAYLVAARMNAPLIYIQSEGKRSRLFRYEFREGNPVLVGDEILPALITLDEYLQAHVDVHQSRKRPVDDKGHRFEQAIITALCDVVDEIKAGINLQGVVEIDIAVRCENQIGIIEVKTGSNKLKMAIDQLNTAAGQTYLGTYTQKFLVSDQD